MRILRSVTVYQIGIITWHCVRMLCEASINDPTRFTPVGLERPPTRGRPPKYYHPLFEKEKHLESVVRRILPKEIADSVCKKSSRLAHLYGLPKTHRERLAMRPILSATDTYNYALAKWLDEKLKPLSINEYTISDIFNSPKRSNICKSVLNDAHPAI